MKASSMPKVNPREVSDPKASFRIPFLDWRITDWEYEFLQGVRLVQSAGDSGLLTSDFLRRGKKYFLSIHPSLVFSDSVTFFLLPQSVIILLFFDSRPSSIGPQAKLSLANPLPRAFAVAETLSGCKELQAWQPTCQPPRKRAMKNSETKKKARPTILRKQSRRF